MVTWAVHLKPTSGGIHSSTSEDIDVKAGWIEVPCAPMPRLGLLVFPKSEWSIA